MPTQITPQTVNRIVTAVDKLCDEVDSSSSNTAAAVKVATKLGLTPNQIQLVCRSYNDGVVNTTRRGSDKFASKFAVPSLINPDTVIAKVFDRSPKTAAEINPVADVYRIRRQAVAQKVASQPVAYEPPRCGCGCGARPDRCKTAGMTDYSKAKQKLAHLPRARQLVRNAKSAAYAAVGNVMGAYAKEHGDDPAYYPLYAKFASELFGKAGKGIVDLAATKGKTTYQVKKYAAQRDDLLTGARAPVAQPIPRDVQTGVLKAVKTAVETLRLWAKAAEMLPAVAIEAHRAAHTKEAVAAVSGQLLLPGESYEKLAEAAWSKRASVLTGAMGAVFGNTMASALVDDTKTVDARMGEARRLLNDAGQSAKLKGLNAEYMLNRLIQSDDVIGSYSPEQVADAFEELATSSPAVTTNPSLLRAHLRRNLQGNLTPYEAGELVSTGTRSDAAAYMPLHGMPETLKPEKPSA